MRNLQPDKTRNFYFSERIIKAMDAGLNYPITIVEAPMGYGKTTAVRECLRNTEARVLWQRIYDNSTTGFWLAFCRLLHELDADRSQNLLQLGLPDDGVSLQEAIALIEEIELPGRTVLVIDDYHLLNGTEVENFIRFLVINEIDNLHIVLTARFIELINIEELSLKGYLCHITKESFELMPNDIVRYYKMCGVSLKDTDAENLFSISEGWISALYLLLLNYNETGSYKATDNINKLVESAIYNPLSEELKEFFLTLSLFDSFTPKQAEYMWKKGNSEKNLAEIMRKNAFINFDIVTQTYQIHHIFTHFLKGVFETKDLGYKNSLYEKAGQWFLKAGAYFTAMHYFYFQGDFEKLLCAMELDKASSFGTEQRELFIRYYQECPESVKRNHPIALLVFAMNLMHYNEMALFAKVCGEFAEILQCSSLDADSTDRLMGEFELLLSFTKYNDIKGMSEHHIRACALLKEPAVFIDTKGSWTFGSPSVLYMFYRECGKLEQAVGEMKECMPYYYQLTNGHGTGAEYLMEAEWYFNKGDYENAEIGVHKALYRAEDAQQPNIIICSLFLKVRLSLMKGDYNDILNLFEKMQDLIKQKEYYVLMHTVDMCIGYVNSCMKQSANIPHWLSEGDFNSSRLYFPARAFSNIIYGRVLLLKGEYLKLLGSAEQFLGIASVFPNFLSNIYTMIYIATCNEWIHRKNEALEALKQALSMAVPDQVYMPFVENCDFIKPMLQELLSQGLYSDHIAKILELYRPYQKALEQIAREHFTENKPKLTERETEIALLAAEGFSNKGIGVRLFISENTVKTQLKSVFEKFGINSRSLLKQHIKEIINM